MSDQLHKSNRYRRAASAPATWPRPGDMAEIFDTLANLSSPDGSVIITRNGNRISLQTTSTQITAPITASYDSGTEVLSIAFDFILMPFIDLTGAGHRPFHCSGTLTFSLPSSSLMQGSLFLFRMAPDRNTNTCWGWYMTTGTEPTIISQNGTSKHPLWSGAGWWELIAQVNVTVDSSGGVTVGPVWGSAISGAYLLTAAGSGPLSLPYVTFSETGGSVRVFVDGFSGYVEVPASQTSIIWLGGSYGYTGAILVTSGGYPTTDWRVRLADITVDADGYVTFFSLSNEKWINVWRQGITQTVVIGTTTLTFVNGLLVSVT